MNSELKSLEHKLLASNTPKKVLSLDGGGVRGILTLGMLKKIETLLREKYNDKNLVLADYYDLIGGTSTGAIIASGLAIGKTVDEIIELYLDLGKKIFGEGRKHTIFKRDWTKIRAIFNENYSSDNLEKYLQTVFGEISINDTEKIKCGLAINTKRADTNSLWTLTNTNGIYSKANGHLKLWELCRASSAAPYYFKPKILQLRRRNGEPFKGAFIDGGVSLANNPAWLMYLVATVPSFGLNWQTGADKLFITSLGTGNGYKKEDPSDIEKSLAISWAPKLSDLFMSDALEMNQLLLQLMGNSLTNTMIIDSQFGDLKDVNQVKEKLFSFSRHNVKFSQPNISELGFNFDLNKIESLSEMDYFENMEDLLEIGIAYAEQNINFNII